MFLLIRSFSLLIQLNVLFNQFKTVLLLSNSIINHRLFINLLQTASILEPQILKHLQETRSNLLQVRVTFAFAQFTHQRMLIVQHLVHVVAVFLLGAAVILSDLRVDLIH